MGLEHPTELRLLAGNITNKIYGPYFPAMFGNDTGHGEFTVIMPAVNSAIEHGPLIDEISIECDDVL